MSRARHEPRQGAGSNPCRFASVDTGRVEDAVGVPTRPASPGLDPPSPTVSTKQLTSRWVRAIRSSPSRCWSRSIDPEDRPVKNAVKVTVTSGHGSGRASGTSGGRRGRTMTVWLDVDAASAYLRVAPSYVRRLVLERRVRYYKLGKYVRFTADDLDAAVAANRSEPAPVADRDSGKGAELMASLGVTSRRRPRRHGAGAAEPGGLSPKAPATHR